MLGDLLGREVEVEQRDIHMGSVARNAKWGMENREEHVSSGH
jgi:hypothetical protein